MGKKNIKWLIGIDEVGRGPLAGPVGVGIVMVPADFDWSVLPGVNDSKRLKPENREAIFRQAQQLKKAGQLSFAVSLVNSSVIDKIGIVPAIRLAMKRGLKKVTTISPRVPLGTIEVKLDGGLKAPAEFVNQEMIVKGDGKEKVIGLASIVAKVTRDRYMERLAKKSEFVIYDFAKHKGYGTKAHRQAVSENGLSSQHRVSFCRSIEQMSNGIIDIIK
ncbi:MAG: ribonuclease HII [Candidatus Nomurabacteria bacterium]|nr:MAG: ribonuclease HII [Candidatus Nomurabacteria bacterium]